MVNKQDSYWMECTLDEKVDQKVCEYLREHHVEYRNTKQKMKELIEREYHFYMGQSMMFSYGSMLAKLKKEIMNPEEGETGRLLDFFMETRTDELEKELRTQNQQYREALEEIKKYEEEIQKLNLSKAVRIQIDRYVSAVNWRWVLCWDFLYRSGMKDILLLFEN